MVWGASALVRHLVAKYIIYSPFNQSQHNRWLPEPITTQPMTSWTNRKHNQRLPEPIANTTSDILNQSQTQPETSWTNRKHNQRLPEPNATQPVTSLVTASSYLHAVLVGLLSWVKMLSCWWMLQLRLRVIQTPICKCSKCWCTILDNRGQAEPLHTVAVLLRCVSGTQWHAGCIGSIGEFHLWNEDLAVLGVAAPLRRGSAPCREEPPGTPEGRHLHIHTHTVKCMVSQSDTHPVSVINMYPVAHDFQREQVWKVYSKKEKKAEITLRLVYIVM